MDFQFGGALWGAALASLLLWGVDVEGVGALIQRI